MADCIVNQHRSVCNQCGTEYQSPSQHWSRSQSCEYRPLFDHQREIVRGLLLGDGSLEANDLAYLRCASKHLEHLQWVSDKLGWRARGVTCYSSDIYRLRTMSHPNLGRYWTWIEAPNPG